MRASIGLVAISVLSTALLPDAVWAQGGNIPWHTTLESARRQAAQTNQLVLIHFWAPWCGACRRMEQEVFTQPNVAAAIGANYVPAKINADHFQKITEQYGVTALPTDVIVTAEGQFVQKLEGMRKANDYSAQLNQIASMARPRTTPNMYAQNPPPQTPAAAIPNAAAAAPPTDSRYADYYRNRPTTPAAAAVAQQPTTSPTLPPYAEQRPAGMNVPPAAGPALGSPVATAAIPAAAGPAMVNPTLPGMATPGMSPPNATAAAPSGYANYGRPAQPPQQPAAAIPAPASPGPAMAAANPASAPTPTMPNVAANAAPAAAPGNPATPNPSIAAGNPPVGLDGFCPVALVEKKQWLSGDPRWGAIHRGRTYLFAGPNEQKQFLDNPDLYAPVASGIDVVIAVERKQSVPGNRVHGGFYGGKVFLFANEESLTKFSANPEHYIGAFSQAVRATGYTPYR